VTRQYLRYVTELTYLLFLKMAKVSHPPGASRAAFSLRSATFGADVVAGFESRSAHQIQPPSGGRIVAFPSVGGLHHRYSRAV
jgi:hypothetical protein